MVLKDAERHVQKGAIALLQLSGFRTFRVNSGMIKSRSGHWVKLAPKGTSDVIACVPRSGRLMAVEMKREKGGEVSDDQRSFLDAIRADGGVAVVVSDLRDLERIIGDLKINPWQRFDEQGGRIE